MLNSDSASKVAFIFSTELLSRVLLAVAITLPGVAFAAVKVSAVDIASVGDHTLVTLESNSIIRFTLFSLNNPSRLLLDLEGVELNATLLGLSGKVDSLHPYLKPIRIGRSPGGVVRLELNFLPGVLPESQVLTYKPDSKHGYRVVLDMYQPKSTQAHLSEVPLNLPLAPPLEAVLPKDGATEVKPATESNSKTILTKREPSEAVTTRAPAPGNSVQAIRPAPIDRGKVEEMLLEVHVNKQEPSEVALVLRDQNKHLLVSADDLRKWRLPLPPSASTVHEGITYYSLDDLAGSTYMLNNPGQTLDINADANLFGPTVLSGNDFKRVKPTVATPGGFVNYDVFADSTAGSRHVSGLVEAGVFGAWGVGVTSFLGNSQPPNGKHLVRLDSTLTRDFPDDLKTLRLGDVINGTSSWGRSVRFGGVQLASNFATQPGFIAFPLPSLSGETGLPSTIDYYFDGARRLHSDVPSGPFSIQDLPVVSGPGEARLVIRDILGREQVITQRIYTSPQLLRKGLQAYSYDVGFLRNNFGIESNDYGRFMASGTHRFGFTNQFTGELHGELLRNQQTLGVGGAYVLPTLGLLSTSLAGSHSPRGNGALASLGFDGRKNSFGYGFSTQFTTEDFAQLGLTAGGQAPKQITQAYANLGTTSYGSFGISYAAQQWRDRPDIRLASATYGVRVKDLGYLGVSLTRFFSDDKKTVLSATFTIPIDARTAASVNTVHQPNGNESTVQIQQSLPAGTGMGYRLLAGTGPAHRLEAGVSAQNDIGTYTLQTAKARGQSAVRASASGGIAFSGDNAFLTRRIDESFGVVEVPGYANVRIYADNQEVAKTNEKGIALLPRLRPYQKNPIRIEEADLPLDSRIDATELDAVPYFRSAVRMKLPVKKSQGALIQVMLDTGEPLPAGAIARIAGVDEEFPSGLRGEIYLTGLEKINHVTVTWQGQSCDFEVSFSESPDPVPNLGAFKCVGVKR